MKIFNTIRYYIKAARSNWKNKYLLAIRNVDTHKESINILLSPKNIFVLVTTSVFILIMLTIALVAFTPLRVYVPGYTNPEDYRNYKKMAVHVDSLDMVLKQNQQYIDNFYNVLNDKIEKEEEIDPNTPKEKTGKELSKKEQAERDKAKESIYEEAEMILTRGNESYVASNVSIPVVERANANRLFLLPPASGMIMSEFNPSANEVGIVIKNNKNTLIHSVADGVIIYAGYNTKDGNTVIIQHQGNMISIYKHAESILKHIGYKVKGGEPIAKMGETGTTVHGIHLYFELWYNGVPVNPLHYIVIN
jgi:Membrane-bound metallopeptidase